MESILRRRTAGLLGVLLAACGVPEATEDREVAYRGFPLVAPLHDVDFTLTDTEGRAFRFADAARGHVTLLFFGYTHCPDICPVHLSGIAAVLPRLPFEVRSRVRVVFVTTDPARDTPRRLRTWLDAMDPAFIGLRGDIEEVNGIQQTLGLSASAPAPARPDGSYDVGHAAQVLAFTPDGVGRVAYPFGTRQADWLHDLPLLARADAR